jgi:hypothetical protein
MRKKLVAAISLALLLTPAAVASSATPAAAAVPAVSPGACNMLNVFNSPSGFDGMLKSGSGTGQGLANMIDLVIASEEEAGCRP